MARFTYVRQDTILTSDVKNDALAAGAALETAALTVEDDINGLRSQVRRILGTAKWYDALAGRDLSVIETDLADLEAKRILFRTDKVTPDISVPTGQSFVVLSAAGGETPAEAAAVSATALGAVVAVLPADVGAASTAAVAGPNPLSPRNLCLVRDAATGDDILSAGRRVYALLQAEAGVVDGDAFDDLTKQVQLTFVRPNATFDALEIVPAADIGGKTINYSYVRRINFDAIPEGAFLSGSFVDAAAQASVTLENAIANEVGNTPQNKHIDIDLGAGFSWEWRDALAARLLAVEEGSGAGTSRVHLGADVDTFDVDAAANDFANGASFGTLGTPIDVNVVAGEISRAADLTLKTTGLGELIFEDSNKGGSNFAGPLKLADTPAEWNDYRAAFGEVSLLNAIAQAANNFPAVRKTTAVVTANVPANNDVGGAGGGTNLDVQIHDLSGGDFVRDHDVYLNGQLLRGGLNAAANFDYYPGTDLTLGQLKFEFDLRAAPGNPDVITVISRA